MQRSGVVLRVAAVVLLAAWVAATSADADRPLVATACGGLAAAGLLLQQRLPLSSLAGVVAGMSLSEALGGRSGADDPYMAMLLWACYGVGRWAGPRRQAVTLGFVALLTVGAVSSADERDLPADLVFPVMFTGVPLLLGRLQQRSQQQVERLRLQADELTRGREAEVRAAAQEERLRIARELHDVVAHSISAVSLQAQVLRRRAAAGQPLDGDDLVPVEHTAQEAMRELRAMLGVLRPGAPEAVLAPSAGVDDLPALVARSRDAGQDVALTCTGEPVPLPPGLSLTVHRLVQEALTNARRHGGPGRTCVHLDWTPRLLVVRVRNPLARRPVLAGHLLAGTGHGLTGMRERTTAYDGRLSVGPEGDGWLVEAQLPLVREGA